MFISELFKAIEIAPGLYALAPIHSDYPVTISTTQFYRNGDNLKFERTYDENTVDFYVNIFAQCLERIGIQIDDITVSKVIFTDKDIMGVLKYHITYTTHDCVFKFSSC